jgi:hypothetical protein
MKRFLLSGALFLSLAANAQKINLAKGKQIVITATANQEMTMASMGMEMKNNNSSTAILEVKDADKDNYNTTYKLTKISLSMDAMGQQNSYDSEKPEDKNSEIGKSVEGKIGKEIKVLINKNSGKSSLDKSESENKEEADENPLKGLMESFGAADEGATVETAFFIIPAGKKVGDVWKDSVVSKQMKEVKTYTLKSITGNEASISLFSKMDGTSTVDTQGMQMEITLSAKTEGEMIVDTKNSLVKKRTSVSDITGNIDMMGQSMPMISKVTAVTEYK